MKDLLVGSTGFVGGNLKRAHSFDAVCHSIDVHDYYGLRPELCIYAGVPAAMYLANSNPNADLEIMKCTRDNLRRIKPRKLVLISTVAVYVEKKNVDENTDMSLNGLSAYGSNRLRLEEWIREDYPDVLIIRLPALYGTGLKKNFLYDLHTIIPFMLKDEKYWELSNRSDIVKCSYRLFDNGFYKLADNADRDKLRVFFKGNRFNALSFTDSRARYQFYNLNELWNDICRIMETDIKLMNLVTPPVTSKEIYQYVTGRTWENHLTSYPDYDVKSVYAELLGGTGGYIYSRDEELRNINEFMKSWKAINR